MHDKQIEVKAWDRRGKRFTTSGISFNNSTGKLEAIPDLIMMEYTTYKDRKDNKLYNHDLITNTSRNGGKPHEIRWSTEQGAWVGYYGIEYLLAEELDEIVKVGDVFSKP